MKAFRKTLISAVAAATILALPAPAQAQAQETAQVLRAVPHAPLEILDPTWTTAYITRSHGYLVYDTLFGMDENLQPQPQMVESWEVSDDALTWTFTLRPGQSWHDGTPVTAADCVASLRRWGAVDGTGQALFSQISVIEAVDDATFRIVLTDPFPSMVTALAQLSSYVPFMMPARIAATPPGAPITDPTGSGPYILSMQDWEPGESAVYLRNTAYVPRDEPTSLAAGGKIAFLDRIEWVNYPDQQAAAQALIANEVHYLESPTTTLAKELAKVDGVSVAPADALGSIGMAVFNHQIPPFDNVDLRRAVLAGMTQRAYMEAAIADPDYWRVCTSVIPCGTALEAPQAGSVFGRADLDEARALVAASGYDGTPVVILDPVDSPVLSAFTRVTIDLFADLGIAVDHQEMTWSELLERRVNRGPENGWNMFHTWWLAIDLGDPMRIAFSGNPATGWIGWPADPELEALRAAYLRAPENGDRARIAADVQARIVDQAHFAILGQFYEPIAFRNNVIGLQRGIQMYYNLALQSE